MAYTQMTKKVPCGCHAEDETRTFEVAGNLVSRVIEMRQVLDRKLEDIGNEEEDIGKKYFIEECKKFQEKVTTEIEVYQQHLKENKCFLRDKYTEFDIMIQAAGPRTAELMRCFYFTINAHCYQHKLAHRRFQYEGTETKIGRGPLWSILSPQRNLEKADKDFLEYLAPSQPKSPWFHEPSLGRFPSTIKLTEYEFHWIFLGMFLDGFVSYQNEHSDDDDEDDASSESQGTDREIELNTEAKKNIMISFLKADTNQYVFETIPAKVLMLRTDLVTWRMFFLELLLSASCLACLFYLTLEWNLNEDNLSCLDQNAATKGNGCRTRKVYFCYTCLVIFIYIEICILVVDVVIWRLQWLTFWNIVEALLKTCSLGWVVSLMIIDSSRSDDWWLFYFSLLMPALSAARWLEFTLLLLHVPAIGMHFMPAVLAAFARESCAIFGCIFMAMLGATHAYLGFRVLENDKTFGQHGIWGIFTASMRISRALMLAEGDVNHLAGRKQRLFDESGITVIDDEDSGDWGAAGQFRGYFECVNIITWLTLMLGVLLMNTYVGVVTEKYIEISNHKLHYLQAWRAQWQVRALARIELIESCVPIKALCVGRMKFVKCWYCEESSGVKEGLWVVSPRQARDDVQEGIKEIKDVKQDIARIENDLKQDIARIENKLDLLLQTQPRRS